MKIGVYTGNLSRWSDEKYRMLKSLGYSCVDYNLADTEVAPYTLDGQEFAAYLLAEKALVTDAGIEISQIHGPWRWPPEDSTVENRAERMEKMKISTVSKEPFTTTSSGTSCLKQRSVFWRPKKVLSTFGVTPMNLIFSRNGGRSLKNSAR